MRACSVYSWLGAEVPVALCSALTADDTFSTCAVSRPCEARRADAVPNRVLKLGHYAAPKCTTRSTWITDLGGRVLRRARRELDLQRHNNSHSCSRSQR